jgi:hypothetical protein
MAFVLAIAEGAGRGRCFRFDGDEVAMGRAPGNDLMLVDAGVSRSHACIREEGGRYVLVDEDSANGTALNGAPIRRAEPLRPGDRIGIGPLVLEFRQPRRFEARRWMRRLRNAAGDLARRAGRVLPGARPPWRRTVGATALASIVLGATATSLGRAAPHAAGGDIPAAVAVAARAIAAPPASTPLAAIAEAADASTARGWYERGRRKLDERRIAPRNLYDAWVSFTTAHRLLDGRAAPAPLDELPVLMEAAERDLSTLCRKLLFTARRFERYGQEQRAEAAYRDVLLHFPGEDPSGCRAQAQRNLSDAEPGDGNAG